MLKAVFIDVDGTLLSHTSNSVPDSTKIALRKLREQGIKVVMSTGRPMPFLSLLPIEDVEFDAFITLNGQICFDQNKKMLFGHPFEEKERKKLEQIFNDKKVAFTLVEEDTLYDNVHTEQEAEALGAIHTPLPPVKEYSGKAIYQSIIYVDKEHEKEIRDFMTDTNITRWSPGGIDIVRLGGGKKAAITEYLDLMQIDPKDTMAFGDGENDIGMLQFCGIGVAMGNAEEAVKEAADVVTDHIDEDGIYNYLKKHGYIQ
jgi:Cof subfamily protein (haloacid dehalogenase superfamily)